MWKFWPGRTERTKAEVPPGLRIYAVGDVHGRVDLLDQVLFRIDADLQSYPIKSLQIFIGDYIDRGPSSCEVLDRLTARRRTHDTVFLKGNHETYLFEFLRNPAILGEWQRLGGLETLMSYGLKPSLRADAEEQAELSRELNLAMPESHREFLRRLPLTFSCGGYFFAHAGVRPGVPLTGQREEDLLWIRDEFLLHEDDFGQVVVHGHTPVSAPEVRSNRINIDTGAYATGVLTCIAMEQDQVAVI